MFKVNIGQECLTRTNVHRDEWAQVFHYDVELSIYHTCQGSRVLLGFLCLILGCQIRSECEESKICQYDLTLRKTRNVYFNKGQDDFLFPKLFLLYFLFNQTANMISLLCEWVFKITLFILITGGLVRNDEIRQFISSCTTHNPLNACVLFFSESALISNSSPTFMGSAELWKCYQ